jgi:hypothetical protein
MKSSYRFRSLVMLAAVTLVTAVASAATYVSDAVVGAYCWGRDTLAEFGSKLLAGIPTSADESKTASLMGYIKQKAFHQRTIKRERPVVMPSWRSCPSI